MDREKIINAIEKAKKQSEEYAQDRIIVPFKEADMILALLKEQEAKPPIHVHEEYPEHDWERQENGDIDDFAYDVDYHNGPRCKRCHYSFCIFCNPNGWNDEPCIIDEYKCPKCGSCIIEGTKFCSKCGQAAKWE